jgi:hypothetical protein
MRTAFAEAVAAGQTTENPSLIHEEHGRSMSALHRWGGARALQQTVAFETLQGREELVYANFTSALREMLATDEEFRQFLHIDDKREHLVVDGQARDAEGTPMVEVIHNGREAAERMADENPLLRVQVVREIGDEIVAEAVDKLLPGQALFTRSFEPIEELRSSTRRKAFLDRGYRDGMSYDQFYVKIDDNTLVAGSFSVDKSDEATYRQQRIEIGEPLPKDATPNTIIRHGFVREATLEEAEQLVRVNRDDHYKRRGETHQRVSITEYQKQHDELIKSFFDIYYPKIADAEYTQRNNKNLQDFATTILQASSADLDAKVRQNLMRVANGQSFSKELSKTMDAAVRYAVVEELRKGLPNFIHGSAQPNKKSPQEQEMVWTTTSGHSTTVKDVDIRYVNQLLATNVATGVSQGRSYGGCSPTVMSAMTGEGGEGDASDQANNPQGAFGGKGKSCKEIKDGDITNCPHCKKKGVVARVPKPGGDIFCDNPDCKLAAGDVRAASRTDSTKRNVRWIYGYK